MERILFKGEDLASQFAFTFKAGIGPSPKPSPFRDVVSPKPSPFTP
jgi:hypothetical protein